jgi:hypothetical protein
MICRRRPLFLIVAVIAIAVFGFAPKSVSAATSVDHGGTYWGSVVVEQGETVEGNITVFFGNATIEGTVEGDVNVIGGSIYENGGNVEGLKRAVGGSVVDTIVPWAPPADDTVSDAWQPDHRITWRIAWDIVALVVFLIFPLRSRLALDRLEQHPGVATLAGLCVWVAIVPVAILLLVTLVLIPLIPIEFVLLTVAAFIGQAALALLIGRRFYELLHPRATPAPLAALVLGLVLLTAAELVPVVGVLVTLMVLLVGVGAVLLTFVPDWAAPGGGPGVPPSRRVIGGPPMTVR